MPQELYNLLELEAINTGEDSPIHLLAIMLGACSSQNSGKLTRKNQYLQKIAIKYL